MITKSPTGCNGGRAGSAKLLTQRIERAGEAMKKQESVKAIQIWRSTGMPRKRARRSFSRIAIMVRPKGERRTKRHHARREREAEQHEIIEGVGVVDRMSIGEEAEIERLAREAAQPVIAAGERAPLEGDVVEHLAEGDRHHGEIDAAPAHDERAEDRAGEAAEQRAADRAPAACSCARISASAPRHRRRGRNRRRGRRTARR